MGPACNIFDPDIPSGAFYCDPKQPRCPGGQECRRGVCVASGVQPDGVLPRADAAPPPDGVPPKGPVHLDGSTVDDAGGCADAAFEPNNSFMTATVLPNDPGVVTGKEICYAGDIDHMRFRVPVGQRLIVTVNFTHADGDLDAVLLDDNGQTVDESKGYQDSEVVEMPAPITTTRNYVIGVVGFGDAVNTYSLRIDLE